MRWKHVLKLDVKVGFLVIPTNSNLQLIENIYKDLENKLNNMFIDFTENIIVVAILLHCMRWKQNVFSKWVRHEVLKVKMTNQEIEVVLRGGKPWGLAISDNLLQSNVQISEVSAIVF